MKIRKEGADRRNPTLLIMAILILTTSLLTSCGISKADPMELAVVDYTPITTNIWPVSTPEEQGLDRDLMADFVAELP